MATSTEINNSIKSLDSSTELTAIKSEIANLNSKVIFNDFIDNFKLYAENDLALQGALVQSVDNLIKTQSAQTQIIKDIWRLLAPKSEQTVRENVLINAELVEEI